MYPLKFKPVFKDYLWGGRNLEKLGKTLPQSGTVAESWEVSCHPQGLSEVAEGELNGKSLAKLVEQYPEILGNAVNLKYGNKFPLLIKLIDANQKLSVQVHPDDAYALACENEFGKHEIWYIIAAEPGAQIIYGLLPGTTKAEFAQKIEAGEVESCLRYLDVSAGDVIDIPPGMVHALGAGILLAEIQQSSNSTYRVYDYDRVDASGNKRPLHIAKALDVIDFETKSDGKVTPQTPKKLSTISTKTILAINYHFEVDFYQVADEITENTLRERFHIYTILEGEGRVLWQGNATDFKKGESLFIPADLGEYQMDGSWQGLKSFVTAKLKAIGISPK